MCIRDRCYNAQAAVDTESMLILAPHITQAGNDKEQMAPTLATLQGLPDGLSQPDQLLADTGYFSAKNVKACHAAGIEPLIAVGRDAHHPAWRERFEEPEAPATDGQVDQMKHTLKTHTGE